MKALKYKINEALAQRIIQQWDMFMKSLEGTKFSKEQLISGLSNHDMKDLSGLSEYLYKNDEKNFISYQPSSDEFYKSTNKDKIVSQLAEYIYKFIVNK